MSPPRAEPAFFGTFDRPLFGWIHRVEHPVDRNARAPVGLVLCNPFGYEAMSAHRTLRHFAQSAAAAGIPAIRFDYHGTGDSAGTDLDPDRLRAWLDSVHSAIDTLRQEGGCERICLLGIRLGATLAALASSERTDIAALIAIAPVVSGKAYIREMRALQMATDAGAAAAKEAGAAPVTDEPMEVTGFLISTATRNELTQVDLLKLTRPPAPSVLVLDRDDLPGAGRWSQHLQSLGSLTNYYALPGYVEMMLSPHSATVPAMVLQHTMDWLSRQTTLWLSGPPPTHGSIDAPACRHCIELPAAVKDGAPIVETVDFLDSQKILMGVLSTPIADRASSVNASSGAILLLNAGGTHHIGPNRLYVTLARRWASLGHVVLRMDISGIGDSLPRPGEAENTVYTTRANEDILQAIRYLRERAAAVEFRAVGLCSGAYHAFKAAVSGAPLDGVVMINPLTFFWQEGMSLDMPMPQERVVSEARRYQKSLFSLESWLKLARGGVNVPNVAHVVMLRTLQEIKYRLRNLARLLRRPLPDDLAHELELVAQRRVGLTFVFAAGDPGIELLKIQGGSVAKTLRKRGRIDIHVIDNADHTFTVRRARDRLVAILAAELDAPSTAGSASENAAAVGQPCSSSAR